MVKSYTVTMSISKTLEFDDDELDMIKEEVDVLQDDLEGEDWAISSVAVIETASGEAVDLGDDVADDAADEEDDEDSEDEEEEDASSKG